MRKSGLLAGLLLVVVVVRGQDAPYAEINNGVVRVGLYLPDTAKGYYRATRFDWSGVMPVVEYKGHRFVTPWFPKYGPRINDAILGPVESFSPVGYGDGETFVQIGVGVLRRTDTIRYSPFRYYPIVDAGKWIVKKRKRSVLFAQRLAQYYYEKEVVLDGAGLRLVHHLRNTGTAVIETDVFDHNFFRMDSTMTGPGFRIDVPGDSIVFVIREPITKVYGELHGKGEYDIRLENTITGIHIRCDRPLSKLVYWGSPTILCPEPYLHIRVEPGQTYSWTIYYQFYLK